MQPSKLVFVQHDPRSGRLSGDSAVKAWTHVARGSWKPRNQFKIKLWRPEEHGVNADDDPEFLPADQKHYHDSVRQVAASIRLTKRSAPS